MVIIKRLSISNNAKLLSILLAYYCSYSQHNTNAFTVPTSFISKSRVQSAVSEEQYTALGEDEEKNNPLDDKNDQSLNSLSDNDGSQPSFSKLQRLKDRMWVRETLEDLTAAEFACSLAQNDDDETTRKKKKKSSVDFENLLAKLDKRIEDMCVLSTHGNKDTACLVTYPLGDESMLSDAFPKPDEECWALMANFGMGSVTYTDEQRSALVLRILASRLELLKAMKGGSIEQGDDKQPSISSNNLDQIREKLQSPDLVVEEDAITKSSSGPYLYVRDDGTVDWDGALQDRAALKKFGTSVWARINGQDPESVDEDSVEDGATAESHGENNQVTVKIVETESIRRKKERLDKLKSELKIMEKDHTALLNSAVTAGSAVANVNLALLEPELRSSIRVSDDELAKKKDEVSFSTLIYELERIYTYLDGELGNTATKGYIPLQDRLNVAEFGLLESQIKSMKSQIQSGDAVDSDVLAVVLEQTTDFKRRLGIDYYVTGFTFDEEGIKLWLNDLLAKSKKGLAFYGKGCQLFFNDLVFSSSLIGKALTGYTLKPREVRTLRRTFKDVITFIPVVIILIIPLSPVGHVLVFGAIQRFFPDFFPSCFTESRQNLLSLYESTEYSEFTIEENWQEKSIRVLEAAGYFMVDNTKKLFAQISGVEEDTNEGKQ